MAAAGGAADAKLSGRDGTSDGDIETVVDAVLRACHGDQQKALEMPISRTCRAQHHHRGRRRCVHSRPKRRAAAPLRTCSGASLEVWARSGTKADTLLGHIVERDGMFEAWRGGECLGVFPIGFSPAAASTMRNQFTGVPPLPS